MAEMTDCGYISQNLGALDPACRDDFAAFLSANGLAEWRLVITVPPGPLVTVYSESPAGDQRRSEFPRTEALRQSIRLMLDQHYQEYLAGR
jgi:hypothetical protein